MTKKIILEHKAEKERFLKNEYLPREKLGFARSFVDESLMKIIIGPRRAGKSIFAFLLLKGKNFAYLNFDDENLLALSTDEILRGIFEVWPDCKCIFFDEIQNLENWEIFVNKLQRRGSNLILTGSNANLLSKELATKVTGRYVPIEIFPFSFGEFLESRNFKDVNSEVPETRGKLLNYLNSYLENGGFPEVVVKNLDAKTYLETLFDAILFKDITKRYKVRYPQKIYDLALYLVSNFCSEFSFTKLKNVLNFHSTDTVQKYASYLEGAYLFFYLNRFSFKMGEQIKSPKKVYVVDNGIILAKSFQFSKNAGRLMENLVFLELLRKGYKINKDVFYYKTRSFKEVDFVIRRGVEIIELIQVCYHMEEEKTKLREVKSLITAGKELKCNNLSVITWDYEAKEKSSGKEIKFVPLWKWFLENKERVADE